MEAKESGKLDTQSLNKSTYVSKLTDYRKKQKSDSKPGRCKWCNQSGHGTYPTEAVRAKMCSAFNKECGQCGTKGHVKEACRRTKASLRAVEGLANEDSKESSSGESPLENFDNTGTVGTIYGAGQFCSFTTATKGDDDDVKAKGDEFGHFL